MARRRPSPPVIEEENDDYWTGEERGSSDRRQHQYPPYYQPYPYQQPMAPQVVQSSGPSEHNAAQSTLTLQQIGSATLVIIAFVFSVASVWNSLSRDLDLQKNNFEQFKVQTLKDFSNIDVAIKELKKINEDTKAQTLHATETLDRRLQDLDSTVAQIYQRVSTTTKH